MGFYYPKFIILSFVEPAQSKNAQKDQTINSNLVTVVVPRFSISPATDLKQSFVVTEMFAFMRFEGIATTG